MHSDDTIACIQRAAAAGSGVAFLAYIFPTFMSDRAFTCSGIGCPYRSAFLTALLLYIFMTDRAHSHWLQRTT